jgi:squalene cyclase
MMNKPAAFIVVENGQTWLRTSAETEEAIRTGFIMETVPLYTAPPTREPLRRVEIIKLWRRDFDKWSCAKIDYDQFCAVVKEAEKAHGIGGE